VLGSLTGAAAHPFGPRPPPAAAALLARPQPDRAGVAKLKTLLPKAGERTVEATWRRIGDLLGHFSPRECANYLQNAGYASI
jgi:hypothetical protein